MNSKGAAMKSDTVTSYYSKRVDHDLACSRLLRASKEDLERLLRARANGWDVTDAELDICRAQIAAYSK